MKMQGIHLSSQISPFASLHCWKANVWKVLFLKVSFFSKTKMLFLTSFLKYQANLHHMEYLCSWYWKCSCNLIYIFTHFYTLAHHNIPIACISMWCNTKGLIAHHLDCDNNFLQGLHRGVSLPWSSVYEETVNSSSDIWCLILLCQLSLWTSDLSLLICRDLLGKNVDYVQMILNNLLYPVSKISLSNLIVEMKCRISCIEYFELFISVWLLFCALVWIYQMWWRKINGVVDQFSSCYHLWKKSRTMLHWPLPITKTHIDTASKTHVASMSYHFTIRKTHF